MERAVRTGTGFQYGFRVIEYDYKKHRYIVYGDTAQQRKLHLENQSRIDRIVYAEEAGLR